jgi:hypothetical protein
MCVSVRTGSFFSSLSFWNRGSGFRDNAGVALWVPIRIKFENRQKSKGTSGQNFEFPVLLVLLYVRLASLLYTKRVGPDQSDSSTAML